MGKELIRTKQAICILVLFLLATTFVLAPGAEAKQDVWIAFLIAMTMALPIYFIYGRILYLFPNNDLYMIITQLFGGVFGRVINIFYIWYSIHIGALVIRNFAEFIQITSLNNTPQIVTMITIGITCIVFCKNSIEVIGRWASFILPFVLIILLINMFFSIPKMNVNHLRPVLFEGMKPVISGAHTVLAFPFAEAVLFIAVFDTLKEKKYVYKVFYIGLLLSGLMLMVTNLRNVLTLGANLVELLYFPSFMAVRMISIGELIERAEITLAVIFILGGLIKVSICIIVASKGIASFFTLSNHKSIIVPVLLAMMSLASLLYTDAMHMFRWDINIYKYYTIPFQLILPLLIYGVAEIRVRRNKRHMN